MDVQPADHLFLTEASAYLRVPVATLRHWRARSTGPRSFLLGRRLAYRRADLDAWLTQRMAIDQTAHAR